MSVESLAWSGVPAPRAAEYVAQPRRSEAAPGRTATSRRGSRLVQSACTPCTPGCRAQIQCERSGQHRVEPRPALSAFTAASAHHACPPGRSPANDCVGSTRTAKHELGAMRQREQHTKMPDGKPTFDYEVCVRWHTLRAFPAIVHLPTWFRRRSDRRTPRRASAAIPETSLTIRRDWSRGRWSDRLVPANRSLQLVPPCLLPRQRCA